MTTISSRPAMSLLRDTSQEGASRPGFVHRYFPLASAMMLTTVLAMAFFVDVSSDGKAMMALGALAAILGTYLATSQPNRFPLLLIAYLPYNAAYPAALAGSSSLNLTNLLIGLSLVAMMTAPRRRGEFAAVEYLLITFMAFGVLGFFTTLSAHHWSELAMHLFRFKRWLTPFLLFFLVRRVARDRDDLFDMIVALVWTASLVGAATWWVGTESGRSSIDRSRVGGILGQANSMGAFLVYYSLPAFAFFARTKRRSTRFLSLAAFLLMVRGMLFTMSRGAYLALASGVASVLLFRSPLYLILAGASVFGATQYASWLLPSSVLSRLGATKEPGIYDESLAGTLDKSSQQRLMLWTAGTEMIDDNKWRGVGLGRFHEVVDDYMPEPLDEDDPRDAHNAYVLATAEMGIPAGVTMVLLFLSIAGASLAQYFRRPLDFDRCLALGVLASLVGLAASCVFGSRFSDENLMGEFWVLVGMLRVLKDLPPAAEADAPEPAS
jgi:O-antigen ligase